MQSSPLPEDLAHPRRDRASLIANITTGSLLLALLIGLVTFWATTLP